MFSESGCIHAVMYVMNASKGAVYVQMIRTGDLLLPQLTRNINKSKCVFRLKHQQSTKTVVRSFKVLCLFQSKGGKNVNEIPSSLKYVGELEESVQIHIEDNFMSL